MAKYVEYKMAKSFKEAINDKKVTLFEIFHMSKEGYSAKRYLCRVRYGIGILVVMAWIEKQ